MLPGPARRDGRAVTGVDDPMINNSIANRVLRDRIRKAFQDRGYTLDELRPDFAVAFYATSREKLDVTVWDYGYPVWPRSPRWPWATVRQVSEYTEGTVIVDVIDERTRELLWRGEARATLSDDPAEHVKELARAAETIVARFPLASPRTVAAR